MRSESAAAGASRGAGESVINLVRRNPKLDYPRNEQVLV